MKDLLDVVGSVRRLPINGLEVDVRIKDVKRSYGRLRYLVSPVAGCGEVWTEKLEG